MDECKPLAAGAAVRGRAVPMDPVKLTLIAPGAKPLKLKYPLSNFAFNFNFRHYSVDRAYPDLQQWLVHVRARLGGAG